MAFYSYLSTKIIIAFITKSYKDLFGVRSYINAFANILVLDVLVIYYMIESYPVRKSSAYLFVPYLLWLLLATYLNGYILMYN